MFVKKVVPDRDIASSHYMNKENHFLGSSKRLCLFKICLQPRDITSSHWMKMDSPFWGSSKKLCPSNFVYSLNTSLSAMSWIGTAFPELCYEDCVHSNIGYRHGTYLQVMVWTETIISEVRQKGCAHSNFACSLATSLPVMVSLGTTILEASQNGLAHWNIARFGFWNFDWSFLTSISVLVRMMTNIFSCQHRCCIQR